MDFLDKVKKAGRDLEKKLTLSTEDFAAFDTDVLDTLEKEHDEVKALLEQLVKSESGSARKALLKKIKLALVPHSRAEEKIVYNAVIAQKDKDAKIDGEEGYHEHALADKMLATLGKISTATSPEFSAGTKVLKELLDHHISEEERNIWKDVQKHFSADQRAEMNVQYLKEKKKVRVS